MKARVSWFVLVFGFWVIGCGGDESTPAGQTTAGTGAAGTAAAASGSPALTAGTTAAGRGATTAGTGAAAGTSGAAGTGTAGTGTAAMSIPCGSKTCMPPPPNPGLSMNPPAPCCFDMAMGVCGSTMNNMCAPPPPTTPACMAIAFSTARTCCITAMNICGVDASQYGMGCLDVSASMGGLKTPCDGPAGGAGGASAGAGGASAGAGGAGGARAGAGGASGAAAGAGGATAGAGGRS